MIPALGADGRKISGVILTPERIDNLADVMPNGKEFLVTQPAEGAASFNIRAKTGK